MQFQVGEIFEGKVTGFTKFGAFVELPDRKSGMVHISEISTNYVKEISDHLKQNDIVKVKIIAIDERGRIDLSIRQTMENAPPRENNKPYVKKESEPVLETPKELSFDEMLNKFKQVSEEKKYDLKRSFEAKRGSSGKKGTTKRG